MYDAKQALNPDRVHAETAFHCPLIQPDNARQGCAKPDSETSLESETKQGTNLDSRIPFAIY
jgi:hypothetical protein